VLMRLVRQRLHRVHAGARKVAKCATAAVAATSTSAACRNRASERLPGKLGGCASATRSELLVPVADHALRLGRAKVARKVRRQADSASQPHDFDNPTFLDGESCVRVRAARVRGRTCC